MIWDGLLILAIVIIFILIARKIPLAHKLQKAEEPEISDEEMNVLGIISQANDAFEKKKYDEAEELYIKAAAKEPKNIKIYNSLGAIYLERQNYFDAKEAYLQATKLDDSRASSFINLGLAYMKLKDFYKARQAYEKAVSLEPNNKKYQQFLEKVKDKK